MALVQNAGTLTKANLKASGGEVQLVIVTSVSSSLRWFQLHDKATAPVAADVPMLFLVLPAGSATQPTVLEMFEANLSAIPSFSNGIGWAISTTAGTFTDAATAAEHTVTVRST